MILILQKIINSKKAGVPLVNEIILLLQKIIPAPVWFLLFLLLVTLIGSFLVPAILNFFGYECLYGDTGTLDLYQVPMDKILQKSVSVDFRSMLGLAEFQLPDDPFPNGDKRFLRINPECFDSVNNGSEIVTGYDGTCVDCPVISNFFKTKIVLYSKFGAGHQVCIGDGFYQQTLSSAYDTSVQNYCYKCAPPNPYYYNHTNCLSNTSCYFTITNESLVSQVSGDFYKNVYLSRIKALGGVKRTQDSSEVVNIQCKEFNKPELYLFSIEIFNATLWLYLSVGYVLVMIAHWWYSLTLK